MLLIRAKAFLSMKSQKFIQTAIQIGKRGKKFKRDLRKNIIQRLCPDREEIAVENREYLRYLCKYCICYGLQSAR
jgi:hypothetical protein